MFLKLDVLLILDIRNYNAKHQTNFRKRKFVEDNPDKSMSRLRTLLTTSASSSLSDTEKYNEFHAYRK